MKPTGNENEKKRKRNENPVFTTKVNENDVLFGRGAPIFRHPGNVKFRQIVAKRKAEYLACSRHEPKQIIAKEIIDEITANNGRFLREVKTSTEAKSMGVPKGATAWVVVGDEDINSKVKQALREGESRSRFGRPVIGSASLEHIIIGMDFPESAAFAQSSEIPQQIILPSPQYNYTSQGPIQKSSGTSLTPGLNSTIPVSYSTSNRDNDPYFSTSTSQTQSSDLANSSNAPTSEISTVEGSTGSVEEGQQVISTLRAQLNELLEESITKLQQMNIPQESINALVSLIRQGYFTSAGLGHEMYTAQPSLNLEKQPTQVRNPLFPQTTATEESRVTTDFSPSETIDGSLLPWLDLARNILAFIQGSRTTCLGSSCSNTATANAMFQLNQAISTQPVTQQIITPPLSNLSEIIASIMQNIGTKQTTFTPGFTQVNLVQAEGNQNSGFSNVAFSKPAESSFHQADPRRQQNENHIVKLAPNLNIIQQPSNHFSNQQTSSGSKGGDWEDSEEASKHCAQR